MESTKTIKRIYESVMREHFFGKRTVAIFCGPRQCGKTSLVKAMANRCLDWNGPNGRRFASGGIDALAEACGLTGLPGRREIVAFDGIAKAPRWSTLLGEFFDRYGGRVHLVATGNILPDLPQDEAPQRCHLYRMHPLGVAELARPELLLREVHFPRPVPDADWEALWTHGGFPEPFLRRDRRFSARWRRLRRERLFSDDIRSLSRVIDIDGIRLLHEHLRQHPGDPVVAAPLAREFGVAETTVASWTAALERFFEGFLVRPWFQNVPNAIRKAPKWYPADWAEVSGDDKRFEALVACHLLKAVHLWTDLGLGHYELRYVRNKIGVGVDFLVAKNGAPWFLAETAVGGATPSDALVSMQKTVGAPHAFRIVRDFPYSVLDAFSAPSPAPVSARSFLSQLF
jgi:hypothetical protein